MKKQFQQEQCIKFSNAVTNRREQNATGLYEFSNGRKHVETRDTIYTVLQSIVLFMTPLQS